MRLRSSSGWGKPFLPQSLQLLWDTAFFSLQWSQWVVVFSYCVHVSHWILSSLKALVLAFIIVPSLEFLCRDWMSLNTRISIVLVQRDYLIAVSYYSSICFPYFSVSSLKWESLLIIIVCNVTLLGISELFTILMVGLPPTPNPPKKVSTCKFLYTLKLMGPSISALS